LFRKILNIEYKKRIKNYLQVKKLIWN